jgi:outer membrane protein assembly factor BamA
LLAGLCVLSARGAAAEPAPVALTSAEFRPAHRPAWYELHWQLLQLPERVVELATAPLLPAFVHAERHRVPQRLIDLLSNDDKTAFLFPYITVGGSDGVTGGVMLMHNDLLGDNERFRISAAVAHNLDFKVKTAYRQDVAWLNGRELGARVSYEEDRDVRYFPVGGASREQDERAIRSDELLVSLHGELLPRSLLYGSALLTLTYRREKLGAGERPGGPSLERGDPEVPPPPGFDRTIDLPEAQLLLAFDTRDSLGRTRSGFLSRMTLTAMHDFNDAGLSAFRGELSLSAFLELLPRARVLVLHLGGGLARPLDDDHQLPWRGHVSLGRETHLRGYKRDRFLDRYAWWAGLEYHYPIYEHELDEIGVASVLFGDLGRAGAGADGLFGEAPRWSVGFGFKLDTARFSVFQLLIGFSPEGVEFTVSAGEMSFL